LYYIVLYCIVLYCIVLYCIVSNPVVNWLQKLPKLLALEPNICSCNKSLYHAFSCKAALAFVDYEHACKNAYKATL